jgi:hypothetical protein
VESHPSRDSADFAAFSFDFDRLRCVPAMLFLVRNWCGGIVCFDFRKPAATAAL